MESHGWSGRDESKMVWLRKPKEKINFRGTESISTKDYEEQHTELFTIGLK